MNNQCTVTVKVVIQMFSKLLLVKVTIVYYSVFKAYRQRLAVCLEYIIQGGFLYEIR